MELKLPYIESKGYIIEDDFIDALDDVPPSLSILVSIYIEEYCPKLPEDLLTTHLLAGLVYHFDQPVPFVFEVSRPSEDEVIFTDLKFIEMDEYLDFINLNLYLEHDVRFNYPGPNFNRK